MTLLCVNIDHCATLRQARYKGLAGEEFELFAEPDPVRAAHEAELGGAAGITVHLREDRRHIIDRDVELLRRLVRVKFNLEMAATEEMVGIACRLKPKTAMLVPEGRTEVTTEGGLDVAGNAGRLREVVKRLRDAGVVVSLFIDADAKQVEGAAKVGADVCEIHTGPYAHEFARRGGDFSDERLMGELRKVRDSAMYIVDAGMRANAGHALNYVNVGPIAGLIAAANAARPGARQPESAVSAAADAARQGELHIGHAIVSRAIFVGLRQAVVEMRAAMREGEERGVSAWGRFGREMNQDGMGGLGGEEDPLKGLPRGTRLA